MLKDPGRGVLDKSVGDWIVSPIVTEGLAEEDAGPAIENDEAS